MMTPKNLVSIFLITYTISVYSVIQNSVVATINVGVTPAGIAITADNTYAYVANNNNYGISYSTATTTTIAGDSVSVLDVSNNLLLKTIYDPSFKQPYTITINPANTIAYVTNSNGTTITMIDLATNTVIGTIDGFNGPSGMAILPNGLTAYVNNYGADGQSGTINTVSVVNLTTHTITDTITVGLAPAALAASPDGAFVYVINYVDGNSTTGTMSVINTSNNSVTTPITGLTGPFGIALTPDGKYAYVTNFGSNNFSPIGTTVSVIDLNTLTITNTITLDIQPSGIAITPDGRFAYATNYNTLYTGSNFTNLTAGQGTVNIIDIASNTVIPPIIAVDQSPDAVAISPNGQYAYISNYTSNTVNVIALPTFEITAQGCQLQNIFLMQKDFINKLTWSASGTSLPVSYALYKDAGLSDLVAIIPASGPLEYLDPHQLPNTSTTYYLVGINEVGTSSTPLAVTVNHSC